MAFPLAYLHLTVAKSKGQDQGHGHFNWISRKQHFNINTSRHIDVVGWCCTAVTYHASTIVMSTSSRPVRCPMIILWMKLVDVVHSTAFFLISILEKQIFSQMRIRSNIWKNGGTADNVDWRHLLHVCGASATAYVDYCMTIRRIQNR